MTAMDALPEIVHRLVATAQPEQIILFGSWAKGTNRPDSDLDLMMENLTPSIPLRALWKRLSLYFGLFLK